jgi:hypothetical protein
MSASAALPPHSAVRLCLTGRTILIFLGEATPRPERRRGIASKSKGVATVRQSLTALCGGKAARQLLLSESLILQMMQPLNVFEF